MWIEVLAATLVGRIKVMNKIPKKIFQRCLTKERLMTSNADFQKDYLKCQLH